MFWTVSQFTNGNFIYKDKYQYPAFYVEMINCVIYDNLYKTTNYSLKLYRTLKPLLLDIYVTSCSTKYRKSTY